MTKSAYRPFLLAAVLWGFAGSAGWPQDAAPLTFERLRCMSWDELQTLYHNAPPGNMPTGYVRGCAVYNPCERLAAARTKIANCMWKGKHFCDDGGGLVNQWAVGRAVRATTYVGTSWIDGKPSLIFDYDDSPIIWRGGRDETREVAPGLYVGAMHMRGCPEPRLMNMFILEACPCGRR